MMTSTDDMAVLDDDVMIDDVVVWMMTSVQ
jgi:hypothetical protein